MPLTLRLEDAHHLTRENDSSRILTHGTLTVGRGPQNDWVLPDPERIVSKQHCTIEADGDTYVLTDTSSNGVFLNSSDTPVGRGNKVQLRDGDQLRIGQFRISVIVGDERPATDRYHDLQRQKPMLGDPLFTKEPTAATDRQRGGSPIAQDLPGELLPQDAREMGPLSREGGGAGPIADFRPDQGFGSAEAGPGVEEEFFQAPEPRSIIPDDWDREIEAGADSGQSQEPLPGPPLAPEVKRPPAEVPSPPPQTSGSTERQAIRAFLEGAGLKDIDIPDAAIPETMQILGALYRETVQGLVEVLAARSSIKGEFRLSQTTIQPVENNPLKFSLNVDEAMTALLTKRGPGYLPPIRAIREAFGDIEAHQVAVMVGMQAALTNLLRRFDPAVLEQRIEKEGVSLSGLLHAKDARCWDEFTRSYKDLVREAEDDFQTLFGREFARAYEEQARKHARHGATRMPTGDA